MCLASQPPGGRTAGIFAPETASSVFAGSSLKLIAISIVSSGVRRRYDITCFGVLLSILIVSPRCKARQLRRNSINLPINCIRSLPSGIAPRGQSTTKFLPVNRLLKSECRHPHPPKLPDKDRRYRCQGRQYAAAIFLLRPMCRQA